jgi:hypothetical protein
LTCRKRNQVHARVAHRVDFCSRPRRTALNKTASMH